MTKIVKKSLGMDAAKDEGRAEVRGEERTEIARNMMNEGFDVGVISKVTGLSSADIARLG